MSQPLGNGSKKFDEQFPHANGYNGNFSRHEPQKMSRKEETCTINIDKPDFGTSGSKKSNQMQEPPNEPSEKGN